MPWWSIGRARALVVAIAPFAVDLAAGADQLASCTEGSTGRPEALRGGTRSQLRSHPLESVSTPLAAALFGVQAKTTSPERAPRHRASDRAPGRLAPRVRREAPAWGRGARHRRIARSDAIDRWDRASTPRRHDRVPTKMVVPESVKRHIRIDQSTALSQWFEGAPGRSPNVYDDDQAPPFSLLMVCAEHDSTGCARYLIARGADVNERNPNPDRANGSGDEPSLITALHVAVEQSGLEMVELLIEAGADVNAQMYGGHTPLGVVLGTLRSAWSAKSDPYPIVKALLRAGVSIAAIDQELLEQGTVDRGAEHTQCISLLRGVRAAGSWKRYILSPHMQILRLRSLVARGRASARPGARRSRRCVAKLISPDLCNEVVWECLSYWLETR